MDTEGQVQIREPNGPTPSSKAQDAVDAYRETGGAKEKIYAEAKVVIPGVSTSVRFKVSVVVGVKPLGGYEVLLSAGSGLAFPSVFCSCRVSKTLYPCFRRHDDFDHISTTLRPRFGLTSTTLRPHLDQNFF